MNENIFLTFNYKSVVVLARLLNIFTCILWVGKLAVHKTLPFRTAVERMTVHVQCPGLANLQTNFTGTLYTTRITTPSLVVTSC